MQDYPVVSGVTIRADALGNVVQACRFVIAVKAEAPPTPVGHRAADRALDVPVFGGLGGIRAAGRARRPAQPAR